MNLTHFTVNKLLHVKYKVNRGNHVILVRFHVKLVFKKVAYENEIKQLEKSHRLASKTEKFV